MHLREYHCVQPEPDGSLGREIARVADKWPGRVARMCDAIDAFASDAATPAYRVAPPKAGLRYEPEAGLPTEVYLVPCIYEDASALLCVRHRRREIVILAVYEDYGGYDEHAQWQEIVDRAIKAIEDDYSTR